MALTIRPARQEDQETIVSFVRPAKLNPTDLHWENFMVAEENGQMIGMRQVKVHSQGTRQVASGFVLPEFRLRGISARLMNDMLTRETGPLSTMVNEKRAGYYNTSRSVFDAQGWTSSLRTS